MPKRSSVNPSPGQPARDPARPAGGRRRHEVATPSPAGSSARGGRSARLAAEVARLEAELAAAQAKLTELEARADVDPLTEVFNRRGLDRELRRSLDYVRRYGSPAALLYLDLDGFKAVNDRHGHAAGDAVLRAVAAGLTARIRASDCVARVGGDEFVLVLWNLGEAAAAEKAAALEHAIEALRVAYQADSLSVGASAGVAMLDARMAPADAIAEADRAMYVRKRAKRAAASDEQSRRSR